MSYQIITDSCCDFTDAQYRHYNVHPVKLTVLWQGREHRNFSEDTQLHEFYESMRHGATATTCGFVAFKSRTCYRQGSFSAKRHEDGCTTGLGLIIFDEGVAVDNDVGINEMEYTG